MALAELVGPPALGKSTLVDACVRGGARDARRSLLTARHPLFTPLSALARNAHPDRRLVRLISDRLLRAPDEAGTEAALAAVATSWGPFLEVVLQSDPARHAPEDLALRLMERSWLLDAVRWRALLEPLRSATGALLLDEGLTHPLKVGAAIDASDPEALRRYAATVPLPDVLVVLDAEPQVLEGRLRERARMAPERARSAAYEDPEALHRLIEMSRHVTASIAATAEERGARVIRLDGSSASSEVLADTLLTMLRSLPLAGPEGHA